MNCRADHLRIDDYMAPRDKGGAVVFRGRVLQASRAVVVLVGLAFAVCSGPASSATIYLCKSYNGSTFWAQAHCGKHNALIERIENVADVPWDQQVQQAEQRKAARTQQAQTNTGESQRATKCAHLVAERDKIESRYTNWQWQPPEVINPDQQRMRGLRAELSANQCAVQ